jgi:hypothetical protein
VKFLFSQVAYLVTDREQRANLRALLGYLLFLAALVALYTVLFHLIKLNVEGEAHSWITGLYWTLVVMTTLGFGDITFTSDIGRLFSIVVLLSGVVFLLVMLPFLFRKPAVLRDRTRSDPVGEARGRRGAGDSRRKRQPRNLRGHACRGGAAGIGQL